MLNILKKSGKPHSLSVVSGRGAVPCARTLPLSQLLDTAGLKRNGGCLFFVHPSMLRLWYEDVSDAESIRERLSKLSDFGNILLENGTDTTQLIDVRCKIYLFTPQGVKLVCVGKHSKVLDGHFYNTDSLFTDKLESLISKGEEVKNDTIINTTPVLLMNRDMFYKRIEHSCLPIMKNEHLDSLKIFVDFNIDRQGNAVDITVKGKGGEVISPILQSEIIRLFQDDFKWSSSQLRSFKIRRIIPITLFSN